MGKVALKPSTLLDEADFIHITHGQCPKCGWSKRVIIAGKEVGKEEFGLSCMVAAGPL